MTPSKNLSVNTGNRWNFLCFGIFASLVLVSCEARSLSSMDSKNKDSHKFENDLVSKKMMRLNSSFMSSDTVEKMSVPLSRSLEIVEIFVRKIKIWFEGMPLSLDENDQRSFEGSTAMSLIDSMMLHGEGYIRSEFSLNVKILGHGKNYVLCDFKISLDGQSPSSLRGADMMFKDMIVFSFNDPSFVNSYIDVLKVTSAAFRDVTSASLTKFEPTIVVAKVVPAIALASSTMPPLEYYHVDDIMLEFYGIAEMSNSERLSLTAFTEDFLLRMLNNELEGTKFERLVLKLSFTGENLLVKMRVFMKASVYVHAGSSIPLNNESLKYIIVGIFMNREKEYLKAVSTVDSLGTKIDSYEISLLSYSPSVYPSTNFPSQAPTLHPSFLPSPFPVGSSSFSPSIFPTYSSTKNPAYTLSRNPIAVPSDSPSNFPVLFPSNVPSNIPSKYPSSLLPSQMVNIPCEEDDTTYRSRYGSKCLVYSFGDCSRMSEIGFSEKEVNDLIRRCKKSCNACLHSAKPSNAPSIISTTLPSPTDILLGNTLSAAPSRFIYVAAGKNENVNDVTTRIADQDSSFISMIEATSVQIMIGSVSIAVLILGLIIRKKFKNKNKQEAKNTKNKIQTSKFIKEEVPPAPKSPVFVLSPFQDGSSPTVQETRLEPILRNIESCGSALSVAGALDLVRRSSKQVRWIASDSQNSFSSKNSEGDNSSQSEDRIDRIVRESNKDHRILESNKDIPIIEFGDLMPCKGPESESYRQNKFEIDSNDFTNFPLRQDSDSSGSSYEAENTKEGSPDASTALMKMISATMMYRSSLSKDPCTSGSMLKSNESITLIRSDDENNDKNTPFTEFSKALPTDLSNKEETMDFNEVISMKCTHDGFGYKPKFRTDVKPERANNWKNVEMGSSVSSLLLNQIEDIGSGHAQSPLENLKSPPPTFLMEFSTPAVVNSTTEAELPENDRINRSKVQCNDSDISIQDKNRINTSEMNGIEPGTTSLPTRVFLNKKGSLSFRSVGTVKLGDTVPIKKASSFKTGRGSLLKQPKN